MSPALANEVLDDVQQLDKPIYRAVLDAVAQQRKVRPVFLERQPRTQRNVYLVAALSRPTSGPAADSVLRTWLLKKHPALLSDFLDALKIEHDKGVVENLPPTVEDGPLLAAMESLLQKHRPELAILYLHAFNELNEARWPNLDRLLAEDPRFKLSPGPNAAPTA